MSKLTQNITDLQSVLDRVNALPEAGTELPELTNPATASELFADKELIDADGNVVKGTFSIDEELTTQDDLIAQISAALEGKAGSGSSNNGSFDTCTLNFSGISLGGDGLYYFYQTVENGNVVLKYDNASTSTIEMVCGSYLVAICTSNYYDGQFFVSPGLTFSITNTLYGGNLKAYAVQANLSAGEIGTVTLLSGGYD